MALAAQFKQFDELLPRYLTFLRGVVDSEDLPLNVGREILQKSKMLNVINKRLVRKSLDMFKEIEKNETSYTTFWNSFGRYIKVGLRRGVRPRLEWLGQGQTKTAVKGVGHVY